MTHSNSRKAIIYCRVASTFQIQESDALAEREQLCREYAEHHCYNVVEFFTDQDVSTSIDNQGLQAMLDFLNTSQEQVIVIIASIDQLAWDVVGYTKIHDAIQVTGGTLESPSHIFDNTSDGRFIDNIYATRKEMEEQPEQ